MIALKSLQVIESPGTFEIHLDKRGEGVREALNHREYDLVDEMVINNFNFSGVVFPKANTVRIELLGFRYNITPGDVSKKLTSLGYRSAKVVEFGRFAEWYPNLQSVYQILCWSGFDRFSRGLHHTLLLDSCTLPGKRFRILGVHDILKGLPAFTRIACVKLEPNESSS